MNAIDQLASRIEYNLRLHDGSDVEIRHTMNADAARAFAEQLRLTSRLIKEHENLKADIERLTAALKPFAEVGQRFVSAVASGAIPAGASLNRLRTEPLVASDLVAAANVLEQLAKEDQK